MRRSEVEVLTGAFLVLGFLVLAFLSVRMAKLEVIGKGVYNVYAEFPTVSGLKVGAVVEMAGIEVGRAKKMVIKDYQAVVTIQINKDVKLQEDCIASIRTKGLLGEKYIRISPGGSDLVIPPNGKIRETEPPVDLEELIANLVFGKL